MQIINSSPIDSQSQAKHDLEFNEQLSRENKQKSGQSNRGGNVTGPGSSVVAKSSPTIISKQTLYSHKTVIISQDKGNLVII